MTAKNFDTWFREFPAKYAPFKPGRVETSGQVFHRYMELDHSRAQEDQRTIEATLSTETPVMRAGYREILRHDDESVNLERASDGSLPLLWGHDQEQLIGVAENVRVYGGRLRARLRFSESTRGEEIWTDVRAGIIRGISIGYFIDDYTEDSEELRADLIATRWTPFEASCVSVPADTAAGIGRALEGGSLRKLPVDVATMDRQSKLHSRYGAIFNKGWITEEPPWLPKRTLEVQQRMLAVKSEADTIACDELLTRTLDEYNEYHDSNKPEVFGINPTIYNSTESNPMEEFSLCRALALTFDQATIKAGGPEEQLMKDTAQRLGRRPGDRITLPEEVLFQRAVTKGGSGGNLIATSHMAGLFIPALRERMISGRMGATILQGVTSDLQIPRQTADSTATWLAGDGSDQVVPSDPTYDKITMKPNSIGCSSTISRKMLLQGDPASEQLVRESLAFAVARALDVAVINGSGASNQPTGILGQTDVATTTYSNGGNPSFPNIVDLEKELMVDDADQGNLGYVTTAAIAAKMKQTEVVATTGNMIWTATDQGEGRMNGYRALTSNLMPAGYVLFGNWSDVIIAMWSGLDFNVDPHTRASYGDIVITVWLDCDVAVRHGESFSEIHEAAP